MPQKSRITTELDFEQAGKQQGFLRLLGSTPELTLSEPPSPSQLMNVGGSEYYVYSPAYGLWEPLADLGDEVQVGQAAAAVHFPETPWREPALVCFAHTGTVICKRIPERVERGDCLFNLATDIE